MSKKYILQRMIEGLEQVVNEMEQEVSTLTAFTDMDLLLKEAGITNLIPQEIVREGLETEAKLRPLIKKYAECHRKLLDAVKQAVKGENNDYM